MPRMPNISTCLWFDGQAEEAARFYTDIFPGSRIGAIARYGEEAAKAAHGTPGSVLTIEFELDGRPFLGLNGGPEYRFNEAISLVVNCETQEEIDHYWARLTADGGQEVQCGWLKDRFGLSWQVAPTIIPRLMSGDPVRANRVMGAILGMKKIDIATLQRAYDGA